MDRLLLSYLRMFCDRRSLVLVLNVAESDLDIFVNELSLPGIFPRTTGLPPHWIAPRVLTNETTVPAREECYQDGGRAGAGVCPQPSLLLCVCWLTLHLSCRRHLRHVAHSGRGHAVKQDPHPSSHRHCRLQRASRGGHVAGGVLVLGWIMGCPCHSFPPPPSPPSPIQAFILRIFRQQNKTGFIRALSDHPEAFGSGAHQADKVSLQFIEFVDIWVLPALASPPPSLGSCPGHEGALGEEAVSVAAL